MSICCFDRQKYFLEKVVVEHSCQVLCPNSLGITAIYFAEVATDKQTKEVSNGDYSSGLLEMRNGGKWQ